MKTRDDFKLMSGKDCSLIRIRNDLIPHYYLLAFPKAQGEPTAAETREMITKGISFGQALAMNLPGDPEAFTVLYSGYSARREKGWHIHIVLLGSRWKKAWLYLVLAGKNVLQAVVCAKMMRRD